MPEDSKVKTKLAWAEPALVSLMSRRGRSGGIKRPFTVGIRDD